MRIPILAVFVVLSVFPRPAGAQAPAPPPPAREGSAEFSFVGTSGNSSTQSVGLGGELIFRPDRWESKVKVSYIRNKAEEELKAQSFVLTARAQRQIHDRLSGFGQYGYQRDRFAGILDRNAIEGGVAYAWLDKAPQKLVVDGALGYANEQRLLGENFSSATFSGGGLYTIHVSSTSDLSEDARYIVSLSDTSDWRYTNAIALTAKISTIFSLKVSNTIRYLNLPVIGFKNTDVVTSIALVAKF
jgi:putative salt-induced outer membrane protein